MIMLAFPGMIISLLIMPALKISPSEMAGWQGKDLSVWPHERLSPEAFRFSFPPLFFNSFPFNSSGICWCVRQWIQQEYTGLAGEKGPGLPVAAMY